MPRRKKLKLVGIRHPRKVWPSLAPLEVPMVETAKWKCIILCPPVLSSKHVFIVLREQHGVSMGSVVDLIEL